jgi:hypothetical protein
MELHEHLIHNPRLIEEGCTFLKREIRIGNYRCGLLYQDVNGRHLYVEVKLKADDKSVGQLLRYRGLLDNKDARYMLAAFTLVHGLKEGLIMHGYEHKEIVIDSLEHKIPSIKVPALTRGESRFSNMNELVDSFKSERTRSVIREIITTVISLPDVYYYLSDGIMFKRKGRNFKFLSITTIGNRLLFHLPVNQRDNTFHEFKATSRIYLPKDPRDKNQIDINFDEINSMLAIKDSFLEVFHSARSPSMSL